MRRPVLLAIAAAALLLPGCSGKAAESVPTAPPGGALVSFGSHRLAVEVAQSSDELTRGLMYRKSLGPNAGMLFLMPFRSQGGFWMKNTLIPLSIAYMTRSGSSDSYEVVDVLEMTPCRNKTQAFRCRTYVPRAPYDVALEAPKGWFSGNGVGVGEKGIVDLE